MGFHQLQTIFHVNFSWGNLLVGGLLGGSAQEIGPRPSTKERVPGDVLNRWEMSLMDLTWLGILHWTRNKNWLNCVYMLCWLTGRLFCSKLNHPSLYSKQHDGKVTVEKSCVGVKTSIDVEDSDFITASDIKSSCFFLAPPSTAASWIRGYQPFLWFIKPAAWYPAISWLICVELDTQRKECNGYASSAKFKSDFLASQLLFDNSSFS